MIYPLDVGLTRPRGHAALTGPNAPIEASGGSSFKNWLTVWHGDA
ncbi:hypothetical protein DR64_8178 [Paraburkholderia xenovorans LB400]|nr:hypothetical protein [Paraburkholderia xenovorans]AIP33980.1 hypothetical protein DR64_8178 [Paraburkholderia xenovorans LB400]